MCVSTLPRQTDRQSEPADCGLGAVSFYIIIPPELPPYAHGAAGLIWEHTYTSSTNTHTCRITQTTEKWTPGSTYSSDALPSLLKQFKPQNYVVLGLVPWSIFSLYIGFGNLV